MTQQPLYQSPLASRYSSPAMQRLWSPEHRARLWRELWLALAQEQRELGVEIPQEAIAQLEAHREDVDLTRVREHERRLRHDVMAHIHALGEVAPGAKPYIHLGATSCFVTDNSDLIILRDGLRLLLGRLAAVLRSLRSFALEYRDLPTLAYTHYQPAQLTTVGKRATLWLYDLASDAEVIREAIYALPFRGCKGTTGTQASYLELFDGDHEKVRELDHRIARRFGFEQSVPVSGQTYSRKVDSRILDLLCSLAESSSKLGTDLRLLQHEGEVLEPTEADQIGSSAMPYKRNPMRAERMCGLARHIISLRLSAAHTAANQWLERTLDDSANRRLTLPEAFLTADAILILATNICAGLEVRRETVERNVRGLMPFMATERWLMLGVRAGGDRQELHETIRRLSRDVADRVERGEPNDLLEKLSAEPGFQSVDPESLRAELNPVNYTGRSAEQVTEFIDEVIDPVLGLLEPYATADEATVNV